MSDGIDLSGFDSVIAKLEKLGAEAPKIVAGPLFREAEKIMTNSKQNYVPVDTGVLRSTGHVDLPSFVGEGVQVTMGFGGPAAPYALIVHERLDVRHPHGQAKYLQHPFQEAEHGMAERLAQEIEKEIEKAI